MLVDLNNQEINKIDSDLKNSKTNPRDIKVLLAKNIITIYHNKKSAEEAEEEFYDCFSLVYVVIVACVVFEEGDVVGGAKFFEDFFGLCV